MTTVMHLPCMTASMRVMSAGDGFKYLFKSVVAGEGDGSLSTPLTRYYTEAGSPPGFWMGSGLIWLGTASWSRVPRSPRRSDSC